MAREPTPSANVARRREPVQIDSAANRTNLQTGDLTGAPANGSGRNAAGALGAAAGLGAVALATNRPATAETQAAPAAATPAATTPAQQTNAPPPPVTQEQFNTLLDFLQSKKYLENPLNGFDQLAYHFRLFLCKDEDMYTMAGGSGGLGSAAAMFTAMDNVQQIIIAETGVTAYTITDVTIDSTVGPNPATQNVNLSKITIKITEPMGVGFLDHLRDTTLSLGVRNRSKCPFYLELTFKGYTPDGKIDQNPLAKYGDTAGRWIWQLQFIEMDTRFDSSGGHYTITAMPFSEGAFDLDLVRIKENMNLSGATLKDMTDNLVKELNLSWRARYGASIVRFAGVKFHPVPQRNGVPHSGRDPGTFAMSPRQVDQTVARNLSMDTQNGVQTAQVSRGTAVTQLFDFMLSNTKEGQDLALDRDGRTAQPDGSETAPNSRGFREVLIFRLESDVKIIGYDYLSEQYIREITLHVHPHLTQAPVTSPQQRDAARQPPVQRQMIDALFEKKFLNKRYEYLFTGLNTEVLDFDVFYNFKWNAIVPQMEGALAQVDSSNPGGTGRVSPEQASQTGDRSITSLNDDLKRLEKLREDIGVAQSAVETTDSRLRAETAAGSQRSQLAATLAVQKAMVRDLTLQRDALSASTDQRRLSLNATLDSADARRSAPAAYREYAETISLTLEQREQRQDETRRISPETRVVSFEQANGETNVPVQGAMGPATHRDRSLFGCVLEQLNGPVQRQLINIKLNVRGDPFWLGAANLARQTFLRGQAGSSQAQALIDGENPALPDWFQGDQTFLLTFKYPFGIDDNFVPQMRANEVFNGIYRVKAVESKFSGGKFEQTLDADILPLIDVARAYAGGSSNATDSETGQQRQSPSSDVGSAATAVAAGAPQTPTSTVATGNKASFLSAFIPYAQAASAATGVDPRIILAQSALETGWGEHAPQNNYFGIKGAGATLSTTEVDSSGRTYRTNASFASYATPESSFQGYASFLNRNRRYTELRTLGANGASLESQAAALARSGYATDPAYGQKVLEIARGIRLN